VNSGRSKKDQPSDVEEALVQINLSAAEEIARQLRIRNAGGLVICDFIDMRLRKNQRRVLERLRECLKEDSAKNTVLGMSEFGLVEMTRQRKRDSLAYTMFTRCPYCQGKGSIKSHETVSIEIERTLIKAIKHQKQYGVKVVVHPEINRYLQDHDKKYLQETAEEMNAQIEWDTDDTLHINDFRLLSTLNQEVIEV